MSQQPQPQPQQPQPQPQQPTGIVGNTRAAGARATAAHTAVKAAWHEGPWFHIGVGVTAVAISIVINQSHDLNLFWSIVAWVGLVRLAKVLDAAKADSWHIWGKVSRTAGWAVLLFALANSGARHFAEGTVSWADNFLGSVWSEDGPDGQKLPKGGDPVDFETLQAPGHTVKKWVPLGATMTVGQKRPPVGQYWRPCGRVTNPAAVLAQQGVPEKYIVVTSRHNSWVQDLELHPELVKVLMAEKLTGVWVEFTLTTGPSKTKTLCPNTLWGAG